MSTTVNPQGTQAAQHSHGAHKAKNTERPTEAGAPADLFASLLALVGQAELPDDALNLGSAATADPLADPLANPLAGSNPDKDSRAALGLPLDHPLAGLLGWPGAPGQAPLGGQAASDTMATQPGRGDPPGSRPEGVSLDGFTPVEPQPAQPLPTASGRAAAQPAFAWRATAGNGASASASTGPALLWQRSSTPATDPGALPPTAHARATVALDERFSANGARALAAPFANEAEDAASPWPGSAGPGRAGPEGMGSAAGLSAVPAPGGADGMGGDSAFSGDRPGDSASPLADDPNNPSPEAQAEADATEVSHWGAGALRHASLRVGEDSASAIDIQLKLQGQEVDVSFTTDNAEARATLREQAGAALGELLQQSGLGLGGVSVGSHGQAREQRQPHERQTTAGMATASLGRPGSGVEAPAATMARPRADGSRPLDVFA